MFHTRWIGNDLAFDGDEPGGFEKRVVNAEHSHGQERGAQTRGVYIGWQGQRLAKGIGHHLNPERRLAEAARGPDFDGWATDFKERGCGEGCFNHSLYEFTTSTGESFRVDE